MGYYDIERTNNKNNDRKSDHKVIKCIKVTIKHVFGK